MNQLSKKSYCFTSESVTEGHPDKVCDTIADRILDELLKQDPCSRSACEVCATTDTLIIMGEITSDAKVDYEKIARDAVRDIGYDKAEYGFCADTVKITVLVHQQSADIALGVDNAYETKTENVSDKYDKTGAGDQGMVFGYAANENEALMPLPVYLSHRLTKKLTELRKSGALRYLRPDGKSQVTVRYDDGKPVSVDAVVVSTQHDPDISIETLRKDILKDVILSVIPDTLINGEMKVFINPTGRFVIGGPHGDSGVTGRKIIVDTYGGACTHGGGAYSGKDATKVDRSASYMARYIAKNVVAAGLADKCRVDVAYAIGVAKPVAVEVSTFGTSKIPEDKISDIIGKVFDLRPAAIIDALDLRKPIFSKTTNYGHFGREGFTWENTDKAEEIKKLAGI